MGTWREVEHTADLAIWVCGRDLSDLFASAAQAMMSLMARPDESAQPVALGVCLDSYDLEALLVDWLNELLYLSERHNVVFTAIDVRRMEGTSLEAQLGGYPIARRLRGIKAATYHELEIERTAEGLCTQIVFDV